MWGHPGPAAPHGGGGRGQDRALSSGLPAGRPSPRARRGWVALGARSFLRPRDARGSALRVTVACPGAGWRWRWANSVAIMRCRQYPGTCLQPTRQGWWPARGASDAPFCQRRGALWGASGRAQKAPARSPQARRPHPSPLKRAGPATAAAAATPVPAPGPAHTPATPPDTHPSTGRRLANCPGSVCPPQPQSAPA